MQMYLTAQDCSLHLHPLGQAQSDTAPKPLLAGNGDGGEEKSFTLPVSVADAFTLIRLLV